MKALLTKRHMKTFKTINAAWDNIRIVFKNPLALGMLISSLSSISSMEHVSKNHNLYVWENCATFIVRTGGISFYLFHILIFTYSYV